MDRPLLARVVACLTAGSLLLGALAAGAFGAALLGVTTATPARAAESDSPLRVTIDSMSPSTIPERGPVVVTGQVTNHSGETWRDLNVYLLTSQVPFTTQAQLDAAAATPPDAPIGARLTDPDLFVELDDLPPGASTDYLLAVPRAELELTGEPGVYWLGVHVLGASDAGRDVVADGRARIFVPLMDPEGPLATVSLVLPLTAAVRRADNGTLSGLESWQLRVSNDGRLGRLVGLASTATELPFTWLVDPAVVDAVVSVAADNPPLDIAPTDDPSPTSGSEPAGVTPSPEQPGPEDDAVEMTQEAQDAAAWVSLFQQQAQRHTVLALPYGNLDVAAATRHRFPELLAESAALSERTLSDLGIESAPAVAPPSGLLPPVALDRLDDATLVLLSEAAAPDAEQPVTTFSEGQQVVVARAGSTSTTRLSTRAAPALALRQDVLSEAAVHALAGGDRPLVLVLPQEWDPGTDWRTASFFAGLDVPWLRGQDLTAVLDDAPGDTDGLDRGSAPESDTLVYPASEQRAELPRANLVASRQLHRTGKTFANLLARNDTVDGAVSELSMLASSYRSRRQPQLARRVADRTRVGIRDLMRQIRLEGPSFVTMSGTEGPVQVTVVNDLDEPVTVAVDARTTSEDLRISPRDPVTLGPHQRASVRLAFSATDIGVHPVRLVPTNSEGQRIGPGIEFSVRTSQVGLVIWAVMGLGAAVLFSTIAVRIARRVRSRKATHGPVLKRAGGVSP